MKVFGVVGLNGTGKDEVARYLKSKYGVPLISVGDIVREIAAKEGIEATRANLDNITRQYFERFGEGYFLKLVVEKIQSSGWKHAGISGIRSPRDVEIVREAFGSDFLLFHIYISDPQVRYQRMVRRGSARDKISYAEFQKQDQVSRDLFHIDQAAALADVSIANDGTLKDLHAAIEKVIQDKKLLD